MTVTVVVMTVTVIVVTANLLQKKTKQCVPSAGADVVAFLGTVGYKYYGPALPRAGFISMTELAVITPKSSKGCKVLEGHALRTIDALEKRRALGVVPQKQPSKRPSDAS